MFKSIFEPHDPDGAFQEQKKNEKKNNKMTTIKTLVQQDNHINEQEQQNTNMPDVVFI